MDVGFFGKLPSHGDFLRRRASDLFVEAWDAWLQACLTASREGLGDRWLDEYLTSPVWRFVCGAGACGESPVAGVMAPSVDRVGRYFPLTVVAELPADVGLLTVATDAASFFSAAEHLIVDTLATEHVDVARFDERVIALGDELASLTRPSEVVIDPGARAVLEQSQTLCWQLPLDTSGRPGPVFEQLLSWHLAALYDPLVLWWTEGSSIVEPCCLVARGLPPAEKFGPFLDGSWAHHQWRSVPARVERGPSSDDALVGDAMGLRFRSAAKSDVGRVRPINQDAFVARPEIGLWAVADGLGGHRDGEVASRAVCDALGDLLPDPSFENMIDAACQRLQEVNEHLLRASTRSFPPERSGSTVVALLVRGTSCAILWAGDSRVYRWRAGQLERLTRDHSATESGSFAGRLESHLVTRAIGVESKLALDLHRDQVRVGDRFLLCSDGLTHTIPDAQIETLINGPDLQVAVDQLIGGALDAGAPDNVTVLIVEACI